MTAAPTAPLYLVATPEQREAIETEALADDVTTVLEAAAAWHLAEVELTDYQRWDLTRIFARRPAGDIYRVLAAVGEDLRDWHRREHGVEVDGWPVQRWLADLSRTAAETTARSEIERARAATA